MQITTCQICARAIKSAKGIIAHHGYTRPSANWQTASCFGARYRSYEVACDALPRAIKSVEEHITRMEATLTEWLATPPRSIDCNREVRNRLDAWGKYRVSWSVIRPANFDPAMPVDKRHDCQAEWDYTPQQRTAYGFRPCDIKTYAAVYAARIADFQSDIAGSKETLTYFAKRLADWKPASNINGV